MSPILRALGIAIMIIAAVILLAVEVHRANASPVDDPNVQCLAENALNDGGIDGPEGMAAVSWVAKTRALSGRLLWPSEVCPVVYQRAVVATKTGYRTVCQFTWACAVVILTPSDVALAIARAVLDGRIPDPTNGATCYTRDDLSIVPPWARDLDVAAHIGHHLYYWC